MRRCGEESVRRLLIVRSLGGEIGGGGDGDLFRRVMVAFVLVRYWGIDVGSSERDLEGGEEDDSIVMGTVMM